MVEFESLERNRSVAVRIAEQIVEHIRSGDSPVGTRLPSETELARQFGVSRPSVREALGALQFVGYIDSVRGSGSRVVSRTPHTAAAGLVSSLTSRDVLHFFEARLLLEPQAAALAARDPDKEKLAAAEELIDAMELVVHEPALHGETDLRVHHALVEVCRNSFIKEMARQLLDVLSSRPLRSIRERAWSDHELPPMWHLQHQSTVRAIRDGDAPAAAESTWNHLASSARNALAVVQHDPDADQSAVEAFTAFLDGGLPSVGYLVSNPFEGGLNARESSI